jgi:hypothetical protein
MPLQKTADFEDCSHNTWGTAPRYTDEAGCVVCDALNSRTLETDNTSYSQELLCEVWFLDWSCQQQRWQCSENEEDEWRSLQPLGVQSEDYATCDSALRFSGVCSVDQVLDQHMTRPEEEEFACISLIQRTILLKCAAKFKMNYMYAG